MGVNKSSAQLTNLSIIYDTRQFSHGFYSLVTKSPSNDRLMLKSIAFDGSLSLKNYLLAFEANKPVPFGLIIPKEIVEVQGTAGCTSEYKVTTLTPWLNKSLYDVCLQHPTRITQSLLWFISVEVSRALEQLKEYGRSHWFVSLETIFHNQYENWFLYDSYFEWGPNYNSLLEAKLKHRNPLAPENDAKVRRGLMIEAQRGEFQDVFALGRAISETALVFEGRSIAKAKQMQTHELLQVAKRHFSGQLYRFVALMVEPDLSRRFTLKNLRTKLLRKEQEIIRNELYETRLLHGNLKFHSSRSTTNLMASPSKGFFEKRSPRNVTPMQKSTFIQPRQFQNERKFFSKRYSQKRAKGSLQGSSFATKNQENNRLRNQSAGNTG